MSLCALLRLGSVPCRWVTKTELLAEMLDQLKRFYWSWDWPLGASSGFEACARALLGESGRAGMVNAAVGVAQVSRIYIHRSTDMQIYGSRTRSAFVEY